MGNAPMTIGLKVVNEGDVLAGSVLRGQIYLSVTSRKVNAHSIRLKMIGIEKAVVHHTRTESDGGNKSKTKDCYERYSNKFYKIDHCIKNFPNGSIPRGQYEFPFELQLKKSLPSSMEVRSGQSYCGVRYEVFAEVFEKPNSIFFSNTQSNKEKVTMIGLPVTPVDKNHDSSLHLPVEVIPISSCRCCCFAWCTKIGTLALETKYDKTTFILDSRAPTRQHLNCNTKKPICRVQFRSENRSKAKVESVRAQITETIEWCVNGHRKIIMNNLATSFIHTSVCPELDDSVGRHQLWTKNGNDKTTSSERLLESKPWRTIDLIMREGAQTRDTYRGSVVQVRHVLNTTINTQGRCTTNPDASALIKFYRNPNNFIGVHDNQQHHQHQQNISQITPFDNEVFDSYNEYPYDITSPQPTAPPIHHNSALELPISQDIPFDNNPSIGIRQRNAPPIYHDSTLDIPMAEAQLVLPGDWNAETAEVVIIPIAEATVVDTSFATSII